MNYSDTSYLKNHKNFNIMLKLKLVALSSLILVSCTQKSESQAGREYENILEKEAYILCVEVDEPDINDNETLQKPDGKYISLTTQPLNSESSIYRNKVLKNKFDFFCSNLSNWKFKKAILSRPYPGGFPPVQYRVRWSFYHKPDNSAMLVTSTWFLVKENPYGNLDVEKSIVSSNIVSEQVHRLRILEQAIWCYEGEKMINDIQEARCSNLKRELVEKYSAYEEEVIDDAHYIENLNTQQR